jgi:hypothetical protein
MSQSAFQITLIMFFKNLKIYKMKRNIFYLPFLFNFSTFTNIKFNSKVRHFSSDKEIKLNFINSQNDTNMIENTWIEYRCQKEDGLIITKELLEIILKNFNNDIILK